MPRRFWARATNRRAVGPMQPSTLILRCHRPKRVAIQGVGMLVPPNDPAARLRHNLRVAGVRQADLASALKLTSARVSQLITKTDFRCRHLALIEAELPGFSVSYYLDGHHPAHELILIPATVVNNIIPMSRGVLAQFAACVSRGEPAATVLPIGGRVVRLMSDPDGVLVDKEFIEGPRPLHTF